MTHPIKHRQNKPKKEASAIRQNVRLRAFDHVLGGGKFVIKSRTLFIGGVPAIVVEKKKPLPLPE